MLTNKVMIVMSRKMYKQEVKTQHIIKVENKMLVQTDNMSESFRKKL